MTTSEDQDEPEGIAIIGLAGRFPGAKNINEFWRNLAAGVESISFFSDEELLAAGIDPAVIQDPNYIRARGILGDADLFDAAFFGFSPKVAELMDPQHRLFLECAWEALEHAGYDPDRYPDRIGVYAGSSMNTYLLNNLYSHLDLVASAKGLQAAIGNDKDSLTTEVSYHLNLRGPGVTVQTSSSTSLSAIHIACQSILNYECDMALAGGVSIHFPEKAGYLYTEGGTTSLDGHCRAYDAQAQGFVSGHGVGVVVLKRLADALADGDVIYAVILGSAMNNDGSLKVSYMAPSVEGQAEVVALAQAIAGVTADMITYIEGHGTATALGDPIEVAGLTQAFRATTDQTGYCALGSVKSNIGHLDSAAGVAGFIKAALALYHKQIPATLHFETPNPQIDFETSPFYVNNQLQDWETDSLPRRAGVTSLGMGGTNAHVILEEAPEIESSSDSRPWQLLLLSARTLSALETATDNLADYFEQHPDSNLADAAYTLQVGRHVFDQRRFVVCQDAAEALALLKTRDPQRVYTDRREAGERSVAFMFTGQGAQYPNMGLDLYESESVFREQVDACDEILKYYLGLDLRAILYAQAAEVDEAAKRLTQTVLAQPALFTIEYALAKLWMAWGIQPQAMIGHSLGEYVAACLAGVFSLEDALALVVARGQLMQQMPHGAMLSLPLPAAEAQGLLDSHLSLAASNGVNLSVVSGPIEAIEAFEQRLARQNIVSRRLHTSHAFHSAMMEPILAPFIQRLKKLTLHPPALPFISNLTGAWITPAEAASPDYWAKHLRNPVRFAEGIETLLQDPARILLEVGPGNTLCTLARQHPKRQAGQAIIPSMRHARENQADQSFLLGALGKLWLAGVQADWPGFYAEERRLRAALPTYPFERLRYWVEPLKSQRPTATAAGRLEKNPDPTHWFYLPSWKRTLPPTPAPQSRSQRPWLMFMDECGVGQALAQRLEAQGREVIQVTVGEYFSQPAPGAYCLNPERADDYLALMADLAAGEKTPEKIVHFWSLTSGAPASFEQAQVKGLYSLLFLAQALGAQSTGGTIAIDIISNHAQLICEGEVLHPEKATLWGAARVIPQEYSYLVCRNIDVMLPDSGSWQAAKLDDQLLAELTHSAPAPVELTVAYRGSQRWTQTYEPVQLPGSLDTPRLLRSGGVYLITGGLGGLGLVVAEYLAQTLQAKLVLVGRAALPARETWTEWLTTHPKEDSLSRQIRKVQALEAQGAQVLVLSADVARRGALENVVAQTAARFGALHGVFHAAGLVGENYFWPIQETGPAECHEHFRAKVEGLTVLEQVTEGKGLDFCLLFSSLSAVLGGLGLAAYAAANSYMDVMAQRHNRVSATPWISVNWDAWQLGGEAEQKRAAALMEFALTPAEGQEALGRILNSALPGQLVVSTGDLGTRLTQWLTLAGIPAIQDPTAPDAATALHSRPDLQNPYVAPRNETEQAIAEIWQQVLGIESIGVHDSFFELGGTSLSGIQVIGKITSKFNVHIPAVSLYEGPTISALAQIISPESEAPATYDRSRSRGERRREKKLRQRQAEEE